NVSNSSEISLRGRGGSGGGLTVEALENLSVYDDAGGASVSIQYSPAASFGVAVGIGAGIHNSTNNAIASVIDSVVQSADIMTVSSDNSSSVTVIGFGVALDLSVADGVGGGASASSATGKITSTNTISANITGGNITSGASIDLTATDSSRLQTGVGSGSLSVGTGSGIGVALAAGSSVSRIEPSHTISAYIGSTSANPETQTNVTADGPIVIQATNNQQISAQTIAVASSIAYGGAVSVGAAATGAGARITTNNNITSGILYGANVESHAGSGHSAVTVEAIDSANLVSTVGSGALNVSISLDPYAMIGGSLGISISEITNNDNVKALVQGASITTSGGEVLVQALGNITHFSESVATSLSISLISIAGAGGNSNIYDNANITASVDSSSSIVTGNSTTGYGSLSVLATTSENVMAQMFGGAGSVGAVGVFMSNATRSGSTVASLTTNGTISVGNLAVKATTNQTITSEGMSVTVGGLAGTGETHRLYLNETVQTNVNGSGKTWNVSGNLSIGASSTNHATAKTSGAGDGQQDVSVALLGVGFFKVYSAVNPVVSTSISDVKLSVSGSSSMGSIAVSDNNTEAQSGSGSAVGGDAARAITDNSPTISFTTSNLILSAGSATFLAQNCGTYTTNADSVYATAVGGSAARAFNTSSPNLTLNLGSGTAITADGSVVVKAQNDMTGLGDASNMNGKTGGIMARVGGGGIVGGFGGTANSTMTSRSSVSLGDGVSISTNATGGKILIGSTLGWNTNQLTYMH
ncbi:MAG: beta strand repeat-containing protein, partial [bacterium]